MQNQVINTHIHSNTPCISNSSPNTPSNTLGMMCIQHQVESNRGLECYVDFLCVAEECFDHDGEGEKGQRDDDDDNNKR